MNGLSRYVCAGALAGLVLAGGAASATAAQMETLTPESADYRS